MRCIQRRPDLCSGRRTSQSRAVASFMMVFENIVNTRVYFSEFGEPSDRICQTQEAFMELWLAKSPSEMYGGPCLQ